MDKRIPLLSGKAGNDGAGGIEGGFKQTLFSGVFSTTMMASTFKAWLFDAGANSRTDITSQATSEVINSFAPFGQTATMGANDKLYVSDTNIPKEIFFDIDTPGVHNGTAFEVKYSTNGISANASVAGLVDSTNVLKNADGVYSLKWTPPTDAVAWTPTPDETETQGGMPSQKWFVITIAGITSTTTAPLCRRMWLSTDTATLTNYTTAFQGSLTVGVDASSVFFFPTIDDYTPFVSENKSIGIDLAVFRGYDTASQVITGRTRQYQYLATDGSWKPYTNVVDTSDDFTNGPADFTSNNPSLFTVRWDVPADIANTTVTYKLASGDIILTGYHSRLKYTAVTTHGPARQLSIAARVRQFGDNNTTGTKVESATTFKRVSILGIDSGMGVGTGTNTLQISNAVNGDTRNILDPENPTEFPLDFDIDNLTIPASGKYLMTATGERSLVGVEMRVEL